MLAPSLLRRCTATALRGRRAAASQLPRPAAARAMAQAPAHAPRRPVLIFNPIAGRGDPAAELGAATLRLAAAFGAGGGAGLRVMLTRPDVHAEQLARAALDDGADLIVASGGDGTIAAVAGALRGSGVPLGVLPRGTANAFSVALGIPTHLDDSEFLEHACDVIAGGYAAAVDVALVTTSEVRDAPCILLAGIGFEAEVVEGAGRAMKDALGPMAYMISGGMQLLRQSGNFHAKVTVDGVTHEGDIAALTVANAAPPASVLAHIHVGDCIPDDGLLEVCGYVASDSAAANIAGAASLALGALFSGGAAAAAGADGAEGNGGAAAAARDEERIFGGRHRQVEIECDPPQKVVVDGELLGTTPVSVRVLPGALRVLVPRPGAAPAPAPDGAAPEAAPLELAPRGAASAAAVAAPGATTAEGMAASAAVEARYGAMDRQEGQGGEDEQSVAGGNGQGPQNG
ncbi:lipid kinase [Raphidocelis subcapitata]|uniref:Lipid kinase n=1 Tax=Raphidocelis subcapitata TaxID=307507 RepID=A0A2V0NVJ2_9CHLO|nr:lipid kinase [Raphidocelis subcapitata]|eukprot:GBF88835.1 lipid kinase [Raphidocelis subcapitata]